MWIARWRAGEEGGKNEKRRKEWEGKSDRLAAECAMGKAVSWTACQLFLCKDDVIKSIKCIKLCCLERQSGIYKGL